jgi:hypothetical protein
LGAAALAEDGEGRTLPLSLSVVRARGARLGVSVDGTVVELDLMVPPERAEAALRLPSWPIRGRATVRLLSRDGSCRPGMRASCWAAELVSVE